MGIMTIDGQAIEFTDEPNVLSCLLYTSDAADEL